MIVFIKKLKLNKLEKKLQSTKGVVPPHGVEPRTY